MTREKRYVGLDKDIKGGMTDTGKIIRDAWAFGLLPEGESCAGWMAPAIEDLWRRVDAEWEKYGFQVANLPEPRKAAFLRIHAEALEKARAAGWSAEDELADDG